MSDSPAQPREQFQPEEIALLYRMARSLIEEREYGELLAVILDQAIEGLGADRGFVVVRDDAPEGPVFRAAVARNYRADRLTEAESEVSASISKAAFAEGRALLLDDALDSDRFRSNPSVQRLALRSVLCAPLVASDEAFALIYLENRGAAGRFSERQRRLLEEVCAIAAPRLRTAVAAERIRRQAAERDAAGAADGILTADDGMTDLLRTIRQVAPTDLPVLIQGETGTGKELLARAVYRHSTRSRGPFVVLNCAAIPATLIESELFGYARGAFTGASADRMGLVAAAHRGTLFLDEIGEMPLEVQPRLLRVLQSGEFMRLGTNRAETADVRFVAATNRDLEAEVEAGRFRSDLFFRLSAITLKAPPLRERPCDIPLLADHFLRSAAARFGRPAPVLGSDCMAALCSYAFPGNVRELESEMARLAAVAPPGILLDQTVLNERIRRARSAAVAPSAEAASPASVPPMALAEMEKRLIVAVLESTGGNRTRAADILGISREGLRTKMQRHGLSEG